MHNFFLSIERCAERGLWRLEFKEVRAWMDIDGGSCDHWNKCDTYIKVYVDGTEVLHSETIWNSDRPHFKQIVLWEMCADADIVVEMWDEDGSLQGGDDLIGRWGPMKEAQLGAVSLFLGNKGHRGFQNSIKARSTWTKST